MAKNHHETDYYKILGVERSATKEEIKKACRQLVFALHPDRNPGNRTSEEFSKLVIEVDSVLIDDEKRQGYNSFLDGLCIDDSTIYRRGAENSEISDILAKASSDLKIIIDKTTQKPSKWMKWKAEYYYNKGVSAINSDKWEKYQDWLKKYKKAEKYLKKAIESDPDYTDAWYELGWVYNTEGEYQKAIDVFRKVIGLNPDFRLAWWELGKVYKKNKQYQEAIESLKMFIALTPWRIGSEIWMELGIAYSNNKQHKEAVESLKKAIEIDSDNENVWYTIGCIYIKNEQYQEAIESLGKAIELNAHNSAFQVWCGTAHYKIKKYSEAVRLLEESLEIFPADIHTRDLLKAIKNQIEYI